LKENQTDGVNREIHQTRERGIDAAGFPAHTRQNCMAKGNSQKIGNPPFNMSDWGGENLR
jgi:hypothetical protein